MTKVCECGMGMENLGNISDWVYTSDPPQWDEVWVCRSCKKKRTIRICADPRTGYSWVADFEEIQR